MKGGNKENNRDAALDGMNISLPEDAQAGPEPSEHFGVMPDNWESVGWFMLMQRRWQVSEMSGQYRRLDDGALLAQMELRGVKKKHRARLLDELMTMESAALEVLNKPEK